jgi:hypothetical protein
MQVRWGGASIASISDQAQRITYLHGLTGLHKLLIKMGVIEVLTVFSVSQPNYFSTSGRLIYAGNKAGSSGDNGRTTLGKNINAFVAAGAGVTVYTPKATYGYIILAVHRKSQ